MTDPEPAELRALLDFEILLADLSSAFVGALPSEVDALVTTTLQRIVEYLELDRSAVARFRADGSLEITHSWNLAGIEPAARVPIERFTWYTEEIRRNRIVVAERLPDDLPTDALAERDYVQSSGLKANLTIPLTIAGERMGGIAFGGFRAHRAWPQAGIRRMRLVGEVIGGALGRKASDEALRRSEVRLRRVLESLPDGLLLVRVDGSISFANEAASRILGVPRGAMLDAPVRGLLPSLDAAARTPPADASNGAWESRRLDVRNGGGAEVSIDVRLSRAGVAEGELVCLLRPARLRIGS
jgi:PAS domain S-box-containing protein